MNESEVNNLATLLVAVLGPVVVKYGITQDTLSQLLPALAAAAWGVYSHWNMKKVDETAIVVAPKKL